MDFLKMRPALSLGGSSSPGTRFWDPHAPMRVGSSFLIIVIRTFSIWRKIICICWEFYFKRRILSHYFQLPKKVPNMCIHIYICTLKGDRALNLKPQALHQTRPSG